MNVSQPVPWTAGAVTVWRLPGGEAPRVFSQVRVIRAGAIALTDENPGSFEAVLSSSGQAFRFTVAPAPTPAPAAGGVAGTTRRSFEFGAPAATWILEHGLGEPAPTVVTIDNSGVAILGGVTYPTSSRAVVSFSVPVSGKAYVL